jgi:hypothetical protein
VGLVTPLDQIGVKVKTQIGSRIRNSVVPLNGNSSVEIYFDKRDDCMPLKLEIEVSELAFKWTPLTRIRCSIAPHPDPEVSLHR